MPCTRLLASAVLLLALAVPARAQAIKLAFHDGHVTLSALNVPVRQILAEWARLGGTRIVNGERVVGPPVTLELVAVPERKAIEILLRDTAGYMAASRPAGESGLSRVDRLLIVPTSTAPRAAVAPLPAPATTPPPTFGGGRFVPNDSDLATDGGDQHEGRQTPSPNQPVRLFRGNATANGIQQVQPQPLQPDVTEPDADQDAPTAPATATNPFGVGRGSTRPGVITPAPRPQNAPRPAAER